MGIYDNDISMKQVSNENHFKTSDLALATVLSLFFSIDSVERVEGGRVLFWFQMSGELSNVLEEYWRGTLRLEPQQYFNQLKIIKTRIHSDR
ncbi:MAG: hypothetical protein ACD_22C00047G0008 [uncultured bacterium]|nr:MAG: hypothetical protein ACD_22C00047G0008 [uncultured bacterium]